MKNLKVNQNRNEKKENIYLNWTFKNVDKQLNKSISPFLFQIE